MNFEQTKRLFEELLEQDDEFRRQFHHTVDTEREIRKIPLQKIQHNHRIDAFVELQFQTEYALTRMFHVENRDLAVQVCDHAIGEVKKRADKPVLELPAGSKPATAAEFAYEQAIRRLPSRAIAQLEYGIREIAGIADEDERLELWKDTLSSIIRTAVRPPYITIRPPDMPPPLDKPDKDADISTILDHICALKPENVENEIQRMKSLSNPQRGR